MKYPNHLKEVREQKNWTQTDMGDFLGMTMQNYQRYEYGKAELRSDMILKICAEFSCTSDYLICYTPTVDLTLASDEAEVVCNYRLLNDISKAKLRDFVGMVSRHPECRKEL